MHLQPLHHLSVNETGIIKTQKTPVSFNRSQEKTLQRLLDLGLVENTPVTCVGISFFGTPKAYQVRGTVLALRKEDAGLIWIEKSSSRKGESIVEAGKKTKRGLLQSHTDGKSKRRQKHRI